MSFAGIKLTMIVPSSIGGLIGLHFYRERLPDGRFAPIPMWTKVRVFGGGAALGIYSGPLAAELLELGHRTGVSEAMGLFIAVFGLALTAAIFRGIASIDFGAIAESWLKRRE
jgi:hypothetical protein